MKKIGAVFMAVTMMMSLRACGNNDTGGGNGQAEIGREDTGGMEKSDTEGEAEMKAVEENDAGSQVAVQPPGEFVLIQGGAFQMGSPEEEAWRSEDEVRHTVTVSDFYMSAYELTGGISGDYRGKSVQLFRG